MVKIRNGRGNKEKDWHMSGVYDGTMKFYYDLVDSVTPLKGLPSLALCEKSSMSAEVVASNCTIVSFNTCSRTWPGVDERVSISKTD